MQMAAQRDRREHACSRPISRWRTLLALVRSLLGRAEFVHDDEVRGLLKRLNTATTDSELDDLQQHSSELLQRTAKWNLEVSARKAAKARQRYEAEIDEIAR